ncbi:tetratricopeptide repeat [Brachionus plicatilis]|uniref:Tetratricopeptide repeat n=1 Tax=Brachionus plicatilis TaxID=10195 RepID=A0A3M7RGG2_BRAPC|nr:tetratricopeptide repeat [Brachionus plicatilis]
MANSEYDKTKNSLESIIKYEQSLLITKESLNDFKNVLEMKRKLLPSMHRELAVTMDRIGLIYADMNDHEQSIDYFSESLNIHKNLNEPSCLAECYWRLGDAFLKLKDYSTSLNFFSRSLELLKSTLRGNDTKIGYAHLKIGNCFLGMHRIDQCLRFYQTSLEIFKKKLAEYHPTMADCFNQMGKAHFTIGDMHKAVEYFERALAIRVTILPGFHLDITDSYKNVGDCYYKMDQYEKAIECYCKSVENGRTVTTDNYSIVVPIYIGIGEAYAKLGQPITAINYYQKSFEIYKKILNENHLDYARLYNCLGVAYLELGEVKKAQEFFAMYKRVQELQLNAVMFGWDAVKRLSFLPLLLTGKRKRLYEGKDDGSKTNIETIFDTLINGCSRFAESLHQDFLDRVPLPNESIVQFARAIQKLLEKAIPSLEKNEKKVCSGAQKSAEGFGVTQFKFETMESDIKSNANDVNVNLVQSQTNFSEGFGDGENTVELLDRSRLSPAALYPGSRDLNAREFKRFPVTINDITISLAEDCVVIPVSIKFIDWYGAYNFIVTDSLSEKDLILGRDFMKKYGAIIDHAKGSITLDVNISEVANKSDFKIDQYPCISAFNVVLEPKVGQLSNAKF